VSLDYFSVRILPYTFQSFNFGILVNVAYSWLLIVFNIILRYVSCIDFALFMISSLYVASVCNSPDPASLNLICNLILLASGRCVLYTLIPFQYILRHITIILVCIIAILIYYRVPNFIFLEKYIYLFMI
jgi:hypothetical protein